MINEDIIRMAQESWVFPEAHIPNILEFASLVAAAEREACAKIVEMPWQGHYREVAAQIRARGQE